MFELMVNGIRYQYEKDIKLIRYLPDVLKLKSVKDGCSEVTCGTCHVLVDGKAQKACTLPISKFQGKKILTVEGLSEREVFVYAFGKVAAVQCGFCMHYLGDTICLVVGETREAVEAAKKLVKVDYEPLEMIQNSYEAWNKKKLEKKISQRFQMKCLEKRT